MHVTDISLFSTLLVLLLISFSDAFELLFCLLQLQAIFRGFQVRKQYRKIIFAVGVLEKVILRWRLKRKGFRGLQVCPGEVAIDVEQNNNAEEDFFKVSRKQAEERVERSVVRVQAMFRSKRAQEDYQKMKLAHHKASVSKCHPHLLHLVLYVGKNVPCINLSY